MSNALRKPHVRRLAARVHSPGGDAPRPLGMGGGAGVLVLSDEGVDVDRSNDLGELGARRRPPDAQGRRSSWPSRPTRFPAVMWA